MSPVHSAASTPPLANQTSAMTSYATPYSLSNSGYAAQAAPFPRRAEHSFPQYQMHNQAQMHNPYVYGSPQHPQPPPPPAAQRSRGPPLPTASIVHPIQTDLSSTSGPDTPLSGAAGAARKRPKYTRSKKGCLTCRSKKIKCDERKPICTRCEHGHRECTWPEAVLPRRPKGAVRGVGNEDDENEEDDDQRRMSIPGSAVSTGFPPSSTTSSHFPGLGSSSPFEPAPGRRDVFDSDVYPVGSQFSMPAIPATARSFYPRAPAGEFYPLPTLNGQPMEDYEFPPRQAFPTGSAPARSGYPNNGSLFPAGPNVSSYNNDLRRASWDSSAPTDGRRPSWDAHASSVSSPASSSLGLARGGAGSGSGHGSVAAGSSSGNTASGGGAVVVGGPGAGGAAPGGLMLLHSPDPLSPFFRSVQERNLVGNLSSFAPPAIPSLPLSLSPPSYSSFSPSSSSVAPSLSYSTSDAVAATLQGEHLASSPVLSSASSADFGMTETGIPYRKSSFPHLFSPLTMDMAPVAPVSVQGVDLHAPSVDLLALATTTPTAAEGGAGVAEWLTAPSAPTKGVLDLYRPLPLLDQDEYVSWNACA
ncbi:SubName: Full=Uncharacterized protein {ECO:0000313/EMBL:CCA67950.1}; Flags: Fragment [Serendipita indica DSM 11827]|nr:SubName: Full=Uncharacterized protein {ECO:0000313/EMBL:CCA67950.1}; Flags: Fragment [Serendipita indica DSM 11827]